MIIYNMAHTQMLNVWPMYLHVADFYGKCWQIYHTRILWNIMIPVFGGSFLLNLYPSLRTSSNPPPGYGLRSTPLEAHPSLQPERQTASRRRRVGMGRFRAGVVQKNTFPLNGGEKWWFTMVESVERSSGHTKQHVIKWRCFHCFSQNCWPTVCIRAVVY